MFRFVLFIVAVLLIQSSVSATDHFRRQEFRHERRDNRQDFRDHHRADFRRFNGDGYHYYRAAPAIRIPLDGGHCSPSAPASFLYFSY
jgi:hypothetical protein